MKDERILLLGSGGREHALAWKLLQSKEVTHLYWSPGQPVAVEQLGKLYADRVIEIWETQAAFPLTLYEELALRALQAGVTLVVIGPDQDLANGATDVFEKRGLPVFGPTREAAKLEWSKAFAKEIMREAKVATARAFTAETHREAETLLRSLPWSSEPGSEKHWVVKADGLALGKGVEVCSTLEAALAALPRLEALSGRVVIEERLLGREVSLFALCDGERCTLLDSAQDYKTLNEYGQGPNTGGMGAVSPAHGFSPERLAVSKAQIFEPILSVMKARGTPFKGLLYAGLMIRGPETWVLEFNCRFGDPETQALLPRMRDDLLPWLRACATGSLATMPPAIAFSPQVSVFVVATSEGYPAAPRRGDTIEGIESWLTSSQGFFAGIRAAGTGYQTNGGRVLGALGLSENLEQARSRAFERIRAVRYAGIHFRTDIGQEGSA